MDTERAPTRIGADPDAFEAFYREHLAYVSRYVALRTTDPHTAADLTAEIFSRSIVAASSYRRSSGPPRAWLTGIARNVVADHARSAARESAAYGRLQGRRLLDEDATERIVDRISAHARGRELLARRDPARRAARPRRARRRRPAPPRRGRPGPRHQRGHRPRPLAPRPPRPARRRAPLPAPALEASS
nr:sigma factor [Nocardioides daphniae]